MNTLADMHECLGRLAAGVANTFSSGGHTYDPRRPSPLRNIARVSTRIHQLEGPEVDDAAAHLANLSPERRAELEYDWNAP